MTTWPSFGATLISPGMTRFRLWAPACQSVGVELVGSELGGAEFGRSDPVAMRRDAEGWFEAELACGAGTRYRYRLSPDLAVPDPASRWQAGDVHDPSIVVDPAAYEWVYPEWSGRPWHESVIYELHVGAFGGFSGVSQHLQRLADLGVTVIELMPVADFAGPRNWGYDGVLPYAPDTAYGTPDELKQLVDTAHGLGLMVLLDVVYNHFGPDGNYLGVYAPEFYRHDRATPWGDAIDFRQDPVRRFFIENAVYWVTEFRFDGLRFDAVHAIDDTGFLQQMAAEIRASVEPARHLHLVLENENNDAELLGLGPDTPGFDAQWADDTHHCLHVMLTGERNTYYQDFAPAPAALLARCLSEGFAYQGEPSSCREGRPRGSPSAHVPPTGFVICLQNHDQIGNRAFGERINHLAHPDALRAATLLLLLTPQIPMLFMGQEWGATAPFLYFAGHTGELAEAVRTGRQREFAHFAAVAGADQIPDPNDIRTFRASIPDLGEAIDGDHAGWLELHRQLLAVRKAEIIPRLRGTKTLGAEVVGDAAVSARWRMGDGTELAIAVNLGGEPVGCPFAPARLLFATSAAPSGTTLAPRSAWATLRGSNDDI